MFMKPGSMRFISVLTCLVILFFSCTSYLFVYVFLQRGTDYKAIGHNVGKQGAKMGRKRGRPRSVKQEQSELDRSSDSESDVEVVTLSSEDEEAADPAVSSEPKGKLPSRSQWVANSKRYPRSATSISEIDNFFDQVTKDHSAKDKGTGAVPSTSFDGMVKNEPELVCVSDSDDEDSSEVFPAVANVVDEHQVSFSSTIADENTTNATTHMSTEEPVGHDGALPGVKFGSPSLGDDGVPNYLLDSRFGPMNDPSGPESFLMSEGVVMSPPSCSLGQTVSDYDSESSFPYKIGELEVSADSELEMEHQSVPPPPQADSMNLMLLMKPLEIRVVKLTADDVMRECRAIRAEHFVATHPQCHSTPMNSSTCSQSSEILGKKKSTAVVGGQNSLERCYPLRNRIKRRSCVNAKPKRLSSSDSAASSKVWQRQGNVNVSSDSSDDPSFSDNGFLKQVDAHEAEVSVRAVRFTPIKKSTFIPTATKKRLPRVTARFRALKTSKSHMSLAALKAKLAKDYDSISPASASHAMSDSTSSSDDDCASGSSRQEPVVNADRLTHKTDAAQSYRMWEMSKKQHDIYFKRRSLSNVSTDQTTKVTRSKKVGVLPPKLAVPPAVRTASQLSQNKKVSRFRVVPGGLGVSFACVFCAYDANDSADLASHKKQRHPHRCELCKIARPTKDSILDHNLTAHGDRTCDLCETFCSSVSKLKEHFATTAHVKAERLKQRLLSRSNLERNTPTPGQSLPSPPSVSNTPDSVDNKENTQDDFKITGYIRLPSPTPPPELSQFVIGGQGQQVYPAMADGRPNLPASDQLQFDWMMNVDTLNSPTLPLFLNNGNGTISDSYGVAGPSTYGVSRQPDLVDEDLNALLSGWEDVFPGTSQQYQVINSGIQAYAGDSFSDSFGNQLATGMDIASGSQLDEFSSLEGFNLDQHLFTNSSGL